MSLMKYLVHQSQYNKTMRAVSGWDKEGRCKSAPKRATLHSKWSTRLSWRQQTMKTQQQTSMRYRLSKNQPLQVQLSPMRLKQHKTITMTTKVMKLWSGRKCFLSVRCEPTQRAPLSFQAVVVGSTLTKFMRLRCKTCLNSSVASSRTRTQPHISTSATI